MGVLEEQIKNEVASKYFSGFNTTKILGNIDFCISNDLTQGILTQDDFNIIDEYFYSFLWAEAKQGKKHNIIESFIQLILTIGKARTFETYLPPLYLGAFDAEKIAFIEYNKIVDIFYVNDFNWNITPSNHETKEFKELYKLIEKKLNKEKCLFYFKEDDKELKKFIQNNFKINKQNTQQISITKNNFMVVYLKWLEKVKPLIQIDWERAKQNGIVDADFYLADLLSKDNQSINENLYVVLEHNKIQDTLKYKFNKTTDSIGIINFKEVGFKEDTRREYVEFWSKYERLPKKEFWSYIIERRDLLVPQDIRERKGSYFTPRKWVEKSQEYLANVLGEDWQDEYYIWDCCAGTGNLLVGLNDKYKIWASTLDQPDVDIMKDNAKKKKINLLESHIFQMDFLNDNFEDKCPQDLLDVIKDPKKREKLVIYINPPYAEGDNKVGKGRKNIGISKTQDKYIKELGEVNGELFAQFFIRIYKEISNCIIAEFSTLKILQAPKSFIFRQNFKAKLKSLFLTPANTFDNVKGQFPIGFFVWDLKEKEIFKEIVADVYDKNANKLENKVILSYDGCKYISDWFRLYVDNSESIGKLGYVGNDFQHQNNCFITTNGKGHHEFNISKYNLIQSCIYLSVRHCIEATWLNDRDQFLYPKDGWQDDKEFQSDCLVYTLFHGQNRISSKDGTNHWIPFLEKEVEPKNSFESHFMTDYIRENKIIFSQEAQEVFDAGKELYKYYHSKENSNPNASFYDIKEYFQGRNDKGKMNMSSTDEIYTNLLANLKEKQKVLGEKISKKVYEYGFLI